MKPKAGTLLLLREEKKLDVTNLSAYFVQAAGTKQLTVKQKEKQTYGDQNQKTQTQEKSQNHHQATNLIPF